MATTFIAGRALDAVTNTGLPGATVSEVNNPSNQSTADSLGAFSLTVSDPSSQLIISYPGYQPIQDTAQNLNGDDWLTDNTKFYAGILQAVRQQGSSLPGNLITVVIILLLFKLFKVF